MHSALKLWSRCFVFLISIILTNIDAYTQHLFFRGIPIDGTIASFQNKLATKGFTLNAAESKKAPAGERVFSGKFNGYLADVSVFYNRKTNLVYEVEVSIYSKNIDVIQSLLDNTLKNIQNKYAYFPEHDEEDGTNLHYRFHILEKTDPIGTIHVRPTYAYLFDEYGKIAGTEYVLQLNYEDKENVSKLTPSVTKPSASKGLYSNDPEKFYKYIVWATEFKKAGDIDKEIEYLISALNYFKYNCVPSGATVSEDDIESEILSAQNKIVGNIPWWANNKNANVYKCPDNSPEGYFYVFHTNIGLIKIYPSELSIYINNLQIINNIFRTKIFENREKELSEYWREESPSPLVVNYGEDSFHGKYGFGDYHWDKKNITLRFEKANHGIYIQLCPSDESYMPIMTFRDPSDIERHIDVLKSLK